VSVRRHDPWHYAVRALRLFEETGGNPYDVVQGAQESFVSLSRQVAATRRIRSQVT
jgi:hypothetical protein